MTLSASHAAFSDPNRGEQALDEKALEAARLAYMHAEANPDMVRCANCSGHGYHHGFGENGADPDWCTHCGGSGYDLADGEQNRPLDEAIRAYLATSDHEKLRTYAHEATKTITDLVGGGSECFAGRIGEMYIADLPYCKRRIRERESRAHERLLKAKRAAAPILPSAEMESGK